MGPLRRAMEEKRAKLRDTKHRSFRISKTARRALLTRLQLEEISEDFYRTEDDRLALAHRMVCEEVEDEWNRWPLGWSVLVVGGAIVSAWAVAFWLYFKD